MKMSVLGLRNSWKLNKIEMEKAVYTDQVKLTFHLLRPRLSAIRHQRHNCGDSLPCRFRQVVEGVPKADKENSNLESLWAAEQSLDYPSLWLQSDL